MASVGWITSAYLYAFFCLGYRYIFHKSIFPVREYILRSFEKQFDEKSEHIKLGDYGIREYLNQVYINPEILLVVPVDNKTFVHLEINFKRYNISLPMHFSPSVLRQLIYKEMPDYDKKKSEILDAGGYLYSPIVSSKQDGKDSIYDYLLGKPFPQ